MAQCAFAVYLIGLAPLLQTLHKFGAVKSLIHSVTMYLSVTKVRISKMRTVEALTQTYQVCNLL